LGIASQPDRPVGADRRDHPLRPATLVTAGGSNGRRAARQRAGPVLQPPERPPAGTVDAGKRNVLGVLVDALDYDAATEKVVVAARQRRPLALTALAVHGVMTGVGDPPHNARLNAFDVVVPDGQPVRWALNLLHGTKLRDWVSGGITDPDVPGVADRRGGAVEVQDGTARRGHGDRRADPGSAGPAGSGRGSPGYVRRSTVGGAKIAAVAPERRPRTGRRASTPAPYTSARSARALPTSRRD
jgi:hypothetical protein